MNKINENRAGYKKTKAGWIPEDWAEGCLMSVSTKISDGIHTTPQYTEESEYYFINGNNLKNNRIKITPRTKMVSYSEFQKHRKSLNCRTILMSINGTIGNLAYFNNEKVVLGKSAAYIVLNEAISKQYVFFSLSSARIQKYFEDELTASTIRNLSIDSIKRARVAIPPLPEQKKIAEILSTWDDAIQAQEKLIKARQDAKKYLSQKAFTLNNKPQKLKGNVQEVSIRNKNSDVDLVLSVTNKKGFVIQTEHFDRSIASIDISNYKIVEKGCFGYNPSRINVGSIALLKDFERGILSPMYVIFKTHQNTLLPEYMNQFIQSSTFRGQVNCLTQGSVRDSLEFGGLEQIKVNLPPIEEQKKISHCLGTLDEEIELLEKKRDALKTQKKGLMQQLLTGAIRVQAHEVST